MGEPTPNRRNGQSSSPQPCGTWPARLQPPRSSRGRPLACLLFLRRTKPVPTSGPLHVLFPPPGAPFPAIAAHPDPSHLPGLSRNGVVFRDLFLKSPSLPHALGVFSPLPSLRGSRTLSDSLTSSRRVPSARTAAEEDSAETSAPQKPPHLEERRSVKSPLAD